jgi:hypothetical protein
VRRPIAVGTAHRLDQQVVTRRLVEVGERIVGEHVEDLRENDAARGGKSGRREAQLPRPASHRLPLDDPVGREVLGTPDPTGFTHAVDQRTRDRARIETGAAFVCETLQRPGECGLAQHPARRGRLARVEKRAASRRCSQRLETETGEAGVLLVDLHTIASQRDRRCEAPCQRQASIALGEVNQRGRGAWNTGRERSRDRQPRDRIALSVEVHVTRGGERCALATVEHHLVTVGRAVQQPETTATEA